MDVWPIRSLSLSFVRPGLSRSFFLFTQRLQRACVPRGDCAWTDRCVRVDTRARTTEIALPASSRSSHHRVHKFDVRDG